jgi:hypothetical protein
LVVKVDVAGLSGADCVHPALWFALLALPSPGEGEARKNSTLKSLLFEAVFVYGHLDWLIT